MDEQKQKRDYLLPASILIAALLVSASLIYNAGKKVSNEENLGANIGGAAAGMIQPKDIDLAGVQVLGKNNAPVTIIEYSDYQCPFCASFFKETMPQLKKDYIDTGKVRFFYKNLAFLGRESISAAEAALCAQDQGKFWEFHDAIFNTEINEAETKGNSENTGNLTKVLFVSIAKNLGMNTDAFVSCFDSGKYKNRVEKEAMEAGKVLQRPSTPTFFVNDQLISGAQLYSVFKQAIDAALTK